MSKDLMIPRFKVIAKYPECPFTLNQVIEMTGKSTRFPMLGDDNKEDWETWIDGENGGSACYGIAFFAEYPYLFKKLEWWEERTVEELPQYIKGVKDYFKGKIYRVADPSQNGREWHIDDEIEHRAFLRYASDFLPATKEEFDQYIQSKQGS